MYAIVVRSLLFFPGPSRNQVFAASGLPQYFCFEWKVPSLGQMMENDSCFPIRVTLPFRNESCGSWFPSELNPYESYLSYIYIYIFIYHIYIYNVCVNIMKSNGGFPTEHPSRFRRDLQAGADGSMAGVEEVAGVAVQNLDHHRVGHWAVAVAVAWPLRGREISNTAKSRGRTGKSMEITLTLCL